jgi:hypothetical protein
VRTSLGCHGAELSEQQLDPLVLEHPCLDEDVVLGALERSAWIQAEVRVGIRSVDAGPRARRGLGKRGS